MKWYGLKHLTKMKKFYKNSKINKNFKTKSLLITLSNPINLNFNNFLLYVPNFWNFLIFKNKNSKFYIVYFFSNAYFFFLPFNIYFLNLFIDQQIKVLFFKYQFVNNFFRIFWTFYKLIFFSFTKTFFYKLKFKGKGYYIYKNIRNTIAMQFGYSHKIRLFLFFINIKFLSKTSILIFGLNKINLLHSGLNFKNFRPINIFTGKGIRFSKQIIYKKTGKISSYR